MNTGIFMDGSISGLTYRTDSGFGRLDAKGCFTYASGDTISFFLGKLPLGSCSAGPYITVNDLVPDALKSVRGVSRYTVSNMARLLLSVGKVGPAAEQAANRCYNTLNFCLEPDAFPASAAVEGFLKDLGITLISLERARNITRRCTKGILKETDVRIPTRDGRYVLADLYRPLIPGKYPVVMSMGGFGKSFINGFCITAEDEDYFDKVEDAFYETYGTEETKHLLQDAFFRRLAPCPDLEIPNLSESPAPAGGYPPFFVPVSSVFEQASADDWVPYGYVVINVEEYGTGKNNDFEYQFGSRNARDYCDAIEWAALQEWSNGRVGLFGASYYAMTQYTAAQYHPKGLAAMIPIMGDYDSYRHYIYSGGGLFNIADNKDLALPRQDYSFIDRALSEPFWNRETYGPEAEYMASADISKIDYPIWTVSEPDASLHGLGSSEAYINCSSKNKKYMMVNGNGIHYWMYGEEYISRFRSFFDYWLKDEKNDIMSLSRADIQIRTGRGGYYWRHEADWPVPGTAYPKLYLDADTLGLAPSVPSVSGAVTYNADLARSLSRPSPGCTFTSEPFREDLEIAGYIKLGLYVSSTTSDMELNIQVRVLDENGCEVVYPHYASSEPGLPLGFGSMKVSHRALDPELSRDYYPVHAHTREAYAPLIPNEVVYCEVGTFPTTGLIQKGWRLRLDIDPVSNRWVDYQEEIYRKGSRNTLYTGGDYLSFLQLPVLP